MCLIIIIQLASSNNSDGAKNQKQGSGWNSFASKKNNQNQKLTLSIKAESQLIYLGQAKEITYCKSVAKNKPSDEQPKKCKNLVNLDKQSLYCVFHCMQMNKANSNDNKNSPFNKYNMNRPTSIPIAPLDGNTKLLNPYGFNNNRPAPSKLQSQREAAAKIAKEMKEQALLSLNSNITEALSSTSSILSNTNIKINTMVNKNKKSDKEILALLDGKQLDKEEVVQIRLAEQQTVNFVKSSVFEESKKELKKLFNSKIMLKPDLIANASVSSQKLVEMKKDIQTTDCLAAKLKVSHEDKKKNYALSSMQSHRDIVKELKDKKKKSQELEEVENEGEEAKISSPPQTKTAENKNSIIASDFLKSRIAEIKKFNKPSPVSSPKRNPTPPAKNNLGFDLELYIGDAPTTKKLLDVTGKYSLSSLKRKTPDSSLKSPKENINEEDKRAKKLKMIEELQGIKSNHSKDVMNPEKNPHYKNYLDKLQQQEDIDNKLTQLRNRQVKVVTCGVCDYTAFSQSNYCKTERHQIVRRDVLQRFFRCKSCKEKTYTLDKVCPSAACKKCGNEKFEPCALKDDSSAQNVLVNVTTNLDFDAI
jgi:hypothetical protein